MPPTASTASSSSSSAAAVSSPKPFGGWMERRAGKVGLTKRWKRHYFALEPNTLVEYFDLQGGGTSKVYPLSQISEVLIEDKTKFVFSFRLHGNSKQPHDHHSAAKPVYFRVGSLNEMQDWVSTLRMAVMHQSGSPLVSSTAPLTDPAAPLSLGASAAPPESNTEDDEPPAAVRAAAPYPHYDGLDEDEDDDERNDSSDDSSDSDAASDFHFDDAASSSAAAAAAAAANQQQTNWGTRMRRFLSRSAWDEDSAASPPTVPATSSSSSPATGPVPPLAGFAVTQLPPTKYDLRTLQVVEYDLVEVFENQRWFPIGGWTAKKSLISDRAHFTSRHGHNRASLFRGAGADANEATAGNEDRHEIPGTQVHVIKEPWQWEDASQWQLQPLIGMQRVSKQLATSSSSVPPLHRKASVDSLVDEPPQSPEQHHHHAPPPPTPSAMMPSTPIAQPQPTPSRASGSTGGGGGTAWKMPFARMSTSGIKPSMSASAPLVLQPAASEMVMTTTHHAATSTALIPHPLSDDHVSSSSSSSDASWSLGFDFTDFDHAIARGVPKSHPPLMNSNVRSRRWVRLRKRVVNLTARLPENDQLALKLFPTIVSYQRQVVCEGWLGTNIRRVWKSRYLKLIRVCDGSWDDGEGRGLVSRPAVGFQLVCYECKERCNVGLDGMASFALEPNSVARLAVANLDKAGAEEDVHCLTRTRNRFQLNSTAGGTGGGGAVVLDGSEESSFQLKSMLQQDGEEGGGSKWTARVTAPKPEKPRSGRFEFVLSRDKTFIFSADSSEDSLIWVNCLNRAADEIKANIVAFATVAVSSPTAAAATANEPNNASRVVVGKKSGLFGLVKTIRHHRHVMESDSDVDDGEAAGAGAVAAAALKLDELTPAPACTSVDLRLPASLSNQGKLKEWEDFEMKCSSVAAFFTLFYGDHARYSMKDQHVDMGDFDLACEQWHVPTEPNAKFPKDEFDFDGTDQVPARLLQFQSYTKSPVGASVTRVEKYQRYYYYAADQMLIITSTTHSLDVPFGDSFAVYERWVVTPSSQAGGVRVRVYLEAIFSKPAGFIGATIKRLIHVQIPKNYLQWKKRAFAVLKAMNAAAAGAGTAADAGEEDDNKQADAAADAGGGGGVMGMLSEAAKMAGPVLDGVWQERVGIFQAVFAVYLMWWMHAMLVVMVRLVEAMDRSGGRLQ